MSWRTEMKAPVAAVIIVGSELLLVGLLGFVGYVVWSIL